MLKPETDQFLLSQFAPAGSLRSMCMAMTTMTTVPSVAMATAMATVLATMASVTMAAAAVVTHVAMAVAVLACDALRGVAA